MIPKEKTGNNIQKKNREIISKELRKNRQLNLHLHTRERRST
jgi:hypothetical protein